MKNYLLIVTIFFIGIFAFTAASISAQEEDIIPSWIKNTASFWVNEQISDTEFIEALQFLVSNNILTIPSDDETVTVDLDEGPGVTNVRIPVTDETRDKIQPSNLDLLQFQVSQLKELIKNPEIIAAIVESNNEFGEMREPFSHIDEKDDEWRIQSKDKDSPFMETLMSNKVADILKTKSAFKTEEFGDVIFSEIIVTNALGANIAITERTEDYDQADEIWWIKAKKNHLQVLDVMYDESANIYSEDIVLAIFDSDGKFIGVLKASSSVR